MKEKAMKKKAKKRENKIKSKIKKGAASKKKVNEAGDNKANKNKSNSCGESSFGYGYPTNASKYGSINQYQSKISKQQLSNSSYNTYYSANESEQIQYGDDQNFNNSAADFDSDENSGY